MPPYFVVVWTITQAACMQWAGQLGSMPLGNGDVAINAWVDQTTGNLFFYISKGDALDANANPIKVALLLLMLLSSLFHHHCRHLHTYSKRAGWPCRGCLCAATVDVCDHTLQPDLQCSVLQHQHHDAHILSPALRRRQLQHCISHCRQHGKLI